MVVILHQLTAAVYLMAAITSGIGVAFARERATRLGVVLLGIGALLHGVAFSLLHTVKPPPPLTDLPLAMSFTAWIGTLAYLVLLRRFRVLALTAGVAPLALLGVGVAALHLKAPGVAIDGESGSLPHAHVLLASAGLALQGLAALAGGLFLAEHHRLKAHRSLGRGGLPSLEALDRAGSLALAIGFPLLTLGVVTGGLWAYEEHGAALRATPHEIGTLVAWAVSAALVLQRFGTRPGARRCAESALLSFGLFSIAVLGVELLT